MNNRCKFCALLAVDIKLITADLFVGAHQFILSLHRSLVYTSTAFLVSNNCKILVRLCVYTSDCSFGCQKVALEGKNCLQHKKLLQTVKVAKKLPGTIYIGLIMANLCCYITQTEVDSTRFIIIMKCDFEGHI